MSFIAGFNLVCRFFSFFFGVAYSLARERFAEDGYLAAEVRHIGLMNNKHSGLVMKNDRVVKSN